VFKDFIYCTIYVEVMRAGVCICMYVDAQMCKVVCVCVRVRVRARARSDAGKCKGPVTIRIT
jgi:hypothetical protein